MQCLRTLVVHKVLANPPRTAIETVKTDGRDSEAIELPLCSGRTLRSVSDSSRPTALLASGSKHFKVSSSRLV